jgi:hypothetical protein
MAQIQARRVAAGLPRLRPGTYADSSRWFVPRYEPDVLAIQEE